MIMGLRFGDVLPIRAMVHGGGRVVLADQPTHTTLAGELIVYVVFPLLVAGVIALGTFCLWIIKRIQTHSEALALILDEVRPPHAPTLTDQIHAIQMDVALVKQSQTWGQRNDPAP